jgi:hypothetical protein
VKLLVAGFLVVHALIHLSYLTPAPPRTAGGPEWPFELTRSWLVTGLQLDPHLVRTVGTVLVAGTAALLVAAGLATGGWLIPAGWREGLVLSGAGLSILTLALFFHPWLILGFAIDAALLLAVLVGWQPLGVGG